MSASPAVRSILRLALVTAGLVLIALAIYLFLPGRDARARQSAADEIFVRMTGLARPVHNRLNSKFTDADGDLLADPPTSADAWIDPPTLFFSYIAEEDPEPAAVAWAGFVKYLSEKTGKPVEYVRLNDTSEQLRALADGRLHVTGLNTGNMPAAVNLCGFIPVARVTGPEPSGGMHRMLVIVPAGSDLQSCADLKGKTIALTNVGSNSGYHAPLVTLKEEFKLLPPADYTIVYSGSHDASIAGIASGRYAAAAVASDLLDRAVEAGRIAKEKYRVIYKSEKFPNAGIGYIVSLDPKLADKVKGAVMSYEWKGSPLEGFFAGSGQTAFAPVNYKDDWANVRRIHDSGGYTYQLK
jgi:phosphonate transport system substrate-binding protein